MKAIIDGCRYDTEKSIEIGSFDNIGRGASSMNDFHYWEASLYKTPRSAKYFLAGEGGPMTQFARAVSQNSWGGGSKILPMTEKEAFEWAQQYLESEIIEEHFGHMIQDA